MVEDRSYQFEPFHSIDIATGMTAIVTEGPEQSVRVEASRARLLERVRIGVVDGHLKAQHDGNFLDALLSGSLFNFSARARAATLHITVPKLSAAAAATGATIQIGTLSGDIVTLVATTGASISVFGVHTETLKANVSSSGRIALTGACETLSVKSSSGGRLNAVELACTALDVDASSGSAIETTARERASGRVGSGANVTVYGHPKAVDIKSSAGGALSIV